MDQSIAFLTDVTPTQAVSGKASRFTDLYSLKTLIFTEQFKFHDVFCYLWMINKHAENSGTDLCHLGRTRASEINSSKNAYLRLQGKASCTSCCLYVLSRVWSELGEFSQVIEYCQGD